MFDNISLEMSIKPFKKTDDEYIKSVCEKVFEQWRPLLKNRKRISIMLWTSDGSEMLDYTGDDNDSFEWAYFIGNANKPLLGDGEMLDTSPHEKKQLYIENPPIMTYGILKKIVSSIKSEGKHRFPNSEIRVGTTLDCGPEFAISDFKYKRHPESTANGQRMLISFGGLDVTASLNADTRKYAAYPNGIPQDTPLAAFLGAQANAFMSDMGFDYLWLSNGLGYGANPWHKNGKIFDGESFHLERLENTKNNVFNFWKLFREKCPNFHLEARGTNYSVGIDYATDGVPLYDIFSANLNMSPPPNSPWAALFGNMGLELMGHMTRICELPGDEFMYRFYLHDPWWANSPWYDRYNGYANDIYLPMAISRIDKNGKTRSAQTLNILTIDNSFGDLPDLCVYEPLPHFLKAEKDAADMPAPLVWVYPMREFTSADTEEELYEMYHGDTFIAEAIDQGLPLNCIVSTDNFLSTDLSIYKSSTLISPIPQSKEVSDKLNRFALSGGEVIYYGSAEKLKEITTENAVCVDINSHPESMRKALKKFGYEIEFNSKSAELIPATLTVSRSDNAFMFSVYNRETTTEVSFRFPLGAPILIGREAEICDGAAIYNFGRSEHCECRVFIKQKNGVVSLKEDAPANSFYHRLLSIFGLEDATVYVFPEADTEIIAPSFWYGDESPKYDNRWEKRNDEKYGVYYYAEHITGVYRFLFPFKDKLNGEWSLKND